MDSIIDQKDKNHIETNTKVELIKFVIENLLKDNHSYTDRHSISKNDLTSFYEVRLTLKRKFNGAFEGKGIINQYLT